MATGKDLLNTGDEKRKLLAVLFADIAGYTALMQEDEQKAITYINKFRKIIESETPKSNGRVVQYYGDGCLLTFDSSTNAVSCAIALQQHFAKDPNIPVRIGIHMGEVLYKNNNAFGNGVNIASRIESMGVPGSILVSKTIRDQILNKEAFLLESLGSFEFKNVTEPIEVFAVANEGFVVPDKLKLTGKFKLPKRKKLSKLLIIGLPVLLVATFAIIWLIQNRNKATTLSEVQRVQPVAVMPFENLTKDKTLDDLGLVVKDWISYGLLESGKAPVIVLDEDKLANSKGEKEKFAAIPTGVGIVINGRFFNQSNEQLAAIAEILDVKTKKILFTLNPVVGVRDSIMYLADELKQRVIEYWGVASSTAEKKPPVYKAYIEYLKGLAVENSNYSQARKYYNEAVILDSTFNAPIFALAALAINNSDSLYRDSVMSVLQLKEKQFTKYEQLNWESLKTRVTGDIENK